MLFGVADDWIIDTAGSGAEALRKMEAGVYSVIVTDMRMPGMDGAALLECVAQRFPATVRVVLSGLTDEDAMLRAVHVAHRFLAKPCAGEALYEVVQRTERLVRRLASEDMRAAISRLGTLPSPPEIYLELMDLLQDGEVTMDAIGTLVARDPALCARVLHVANSAFFSRAAKPISQVRPAVARIGTRVLRSLALACGVFETNAEPAVRAELARLQRHALAAATIALQLDQDPASRDESFTATLLHDVGVVALLAADPAHLRVLSAEPREQERREREAFGATHAEIGAYILDLWGLPTSTVEAVATHHASELIPLHHARVAAVAFVAAAVEAGDRLRPELLAAYELNQPLAALGRAGEAA
jgi:HD-like signal output (HDOD) protein